MQENKLTREEENISAVWFFAMKRGMAEQKYEADEIAEIDLGLPPMSNGRKMAEDIELYAALKRIVKPEYHHVMDNIFQQS